jgi:hypothetical protein
MVARNPFKVQVEFFSSQSKKMNQDMNSRCEEPLARCGRIDKRLFNLRVSGPQASVAKL